MELAVGWLRDTPEFRFEITGLLADESTAAYRWSYEVPGASRPRSPSTASPG